MSDFKLKVIAETQTAERSLKQVGEIADKATKARSLDIKVPSLSGVTKTFQTLERDVKNAANTINTFYKVGKALPGNFGESVRAIENVGKGAAKSAIALNNNNTAAEIFSNTLKGATGAAGQLVTTLAKVGFATFAIKETVGLLQAAFTGFFNNTIGREVKLRETILKTQTTLASTNKVFKDGKEITDPYQKIVTLTGAVQKNIDSIRERSIALAGVTSNDVIEVFGIVASQIGQIGGGLKEAEDLAINFAAALGTFGLPIYQARQEIGSILRGDVGPDSILAKSLQISSKDIAEAKTKVGGVVKFLEERLAAAVAGQKIAALGFSGVVSNIKDLGELVGQNFGRGMLQPLLNSLTAVFETLFRIRTQIFDIASKAGETVGRVGTLVVGLTAGRTGAGKGVDASAAASAAAGVANKAFTEIETVAQRTVGAISQVIAALQPTALILADAFRNIVEAFVQIKVGTFEALASALANIATAAGTVAPAFATIFNLYARFLNTPIVKYFAEVATVLALLKRAGLDAATSLLLFGKFVVSSVIPALGVFGTAAGAVVAGIAAIGLAIGKLVLVLAGLASALVTPAAAIPAVAAAFQALSASLTNVGNQAVGANTKLAGLSKGLTALGATAKAAGGAILASLGWVVAFQVGIAVVVDALGRYQRAQENQKASARAAEALRRLKTTYKDVGDSADSATKAARDFEQAIVNAQYDRNIDALEKVREKINQIRYELKPGIQSWGEFWAAASGEEMGKFEARAQSALAAGLAEEAKLKAQLSSVDAQRDRKLGEENVKLIANKKIDLNKEIAELERQQQNDLFQQRQTLAQKEVEIFRAAGELRIFQMEQANAKLIEGEEGASRTALEALNNYLSVRENGELAIEAAKKEITIEVANLEKTIADYRFENEKKIAEIRKRSGENEKAMADAQRQAAGQAPAGAGGGGATGLTQGNTGTSSSGPHFHVSGAASEAEARGIFAPDVNKKLTLTDVPGSPRGRDGKRKHAGYDLAGPAGTPLNLAPGYSVSKFTRDPNGLGGNYADIAGPNSKSYKVMHLKDPGASYKVPGAAPGDAAAATPTPALQSLDVLAPAAEAYAAAVRGVASAMERVRALQAALTEAQTVAAFEAIAKAAFPQVQLEGYEDNLFEVGATYDAVATSAASAFDPERAAITIDRTMKIAAANREVKQILDEVEKRQKSGLITQKEGNKLADDLAAKQAKYLADLAKEEEAKKRILTIQQASAFLQSLKTDTAAIYEEIEVINKRNELELAGESPERIQAELNKLAINKELQRQLIAINTALAEQLAKRDAIAASIAKAQPKDVANLQKDLDAANAEITRLTGMQTALPAAAGAKGMAEDYKVAAQTKTEPQKIESRLAAVKKELKDLTSLSYQVTQGAEMIGKAFSQSFMGLISGSMSAKEALASFFKSVGDHFMDMATRMIAKMIEMFILQTILGIAGSAAGAGLSSGFNAGSASALPTDSAGWAKSFTTPIKFAEGGFVTGPTSAVIGEGGESEYVIPASKMQSAMSRYSRGARGEGVIAGSGGGTEGGGGAAAAGPMVVDVRYSVERINDVEYVTASQFQAGMRQAAQQGATQGEKRALRQLQQNTSIRGRVGLR